MIRRPLAIFGITYFIALMAVAYLSPVCLLLPAAIFIILFFCYRARKRDTRYFALVLSGMVLALIIHFGTVYTMVRPVHSKIGESGSAIVTVIEREASYQSGMSRGVLLVEEWNGNKANFRVECAAFPEMDPGERAALTLTLDEPEESGKLQHYADKVYLSSEFTGKCSFLEDSRAWWVVLFRMRSRLSQVLRRYLSDSGGSVAAAMVVGDKTKLSYSIRRIFRRAGLSHLLVVSGLHVNLLCAMFWHRKNGKARFYRLRAVFSIITAILLMAITGFTPSVCRAGITAILYYMGIALALPPDGLTSIAVSALLLCIGNGYAVCDLGLQLSFAATMGLIWWSLIHENLSFRWFIKHAEDEKTKKLAAQRFLQLRVSSILFEPALISVAITPVLLLNDYALNGASVPANILTIWLVPYILALGYVTTLAGLIPVLHFLYRGCSLLLELCLRLLFALSGFCGELPFAHYTLPPLYTCYVLLLLGALVWFGWYRGRARWLLVSIPLCLTAALVLGTVSQRDVVQLTLVGNRAYPCIVATENGECGIIFRGGASNANALERYLDRHALDDVNYVIDIRKDPVFSPPHGKETILANEHSGESMAFLKNVSAGVLSQKNGNLVVLSVDDWQMAVGTGKTALDENARVDVYAVGGVIPDSPAAQVYMTRSSLLLPEKNTLIYRGEKYPGVEIRPGKSVRYKGGKWLAE